MVHAANKALKGPAVRLGKSVLEGSQAPQVLVVKTVQMEHPAWRDLRAKPVSGGRMDRRAPQDPRAFLV